MTDIALPARVGSTRGWQRWAPYAAAAWSLLYAALGLYWALGGGSFPYAPAGEESVMGPLLGRLGQAAAWTVVIAAGLPAAALGAAMLRGAKKLRLLLILAGALLSVVLLLFMTDLTLLISLGYIPFILFSVITGLGYGQSVLKELIQGWWVIAHQLWCLIGGFLWLAATVSYARRSSQACLYCGRRDGPQGWTSPQHAARWGRIAVYVALIAPVIYAATRYAWALGIFWGITPENWKAGQARGTWTGGLFLATFGLVGGLLMLGLVQRWGETVPRWIPGLAGRRVPIWLAVIPAAIVSVLLIVGGVAILFGYIQIAGEAVATGDNMVIMVGPTFLFPLWGAALAVATLGYYYRRRGPCKFCGRGAPGG